MINLIPTAARKIVTREYWMRVSIVWILLASGVVALVTVLQFPSYILLSSQLAAYSSQYQSAQLEQSDYKTSSLVVRDTNELARHLIPHEEHPTFSERIAAIDALAGQKISITRFAISRNEKDGENIRVSGVAQTRSALTEFSANLTADAAFDEAKVPISNLAKDRNINFEIDVVPHNKE